MSDCSDLLASGLTKRFSFEMTGDYKRHFRSYLQSDQFAKDVESGSWNLSGTVPIEGVPLGGSFGHNQAEQSEFRRRLQTMTDDQVTLFMHRLTQICLPDVEAMHEYVLCRRNGIDLVFHSAQPTAVSWEVSYAKTRDRDAWPKVGEILSSNDNKVSGIAKNDKIDGHKLISVARQDIYETAWFVLNTDAGDVFGQVQATSKSDNFTGAWNDVVTHVLDLATKGFVPQFLRWSGNFQCNLRYVGGQVEIEPYDPRMGILWRNFVTNHPASQWRIVQTLGGANKKYYAFAVKHEATGFLPAAVVTKLREQEL